MKYIFCAVAFAVAVVIWIITTIWSIMDKKRQMATVNGANYRKENGSFDMMKYAQGNAMATVPNRQNNSGPNPETYDKNIPYVNHFDTLDCMILKKRNTK